ncbi:hypothetical protein Mtc_0306 [Methanocella conradii HZ254]|uniref:Uncharacterized protein n=1 Tax=Methanocella conradii (strain DSM 24694 / JCM 17849 / CGMCC 1.5162 / HZ254) TaxID=1041930 RepID=H8I974_METCZ|nr:hypothetical protein [Methanocella conradii]AFC99077.1 hypothetical protein Mtc_0306 [Methanocella conradii HZ254]
MKSNKKLIYLMIGLGVVLLAFLLFIYIFNVYHVSYSGDKGIAESKARQVFFWKDFPFTVIPYSVYIGQKYDPFFQHHSLYWVRGYTGGFLPGIGNVVIAMGEDHRAYSLPDEFNEVVKGENISVDSDAKALLAANAYVNSSCVYGVGKLLYNVSDVPGLSIVNGTYQDETRRMQGERLKSVITPPVVSLEDDGYVIDFYSWKELMGALEKWKVKVGKNGAITVISEEEIDSQIGNNFGLG